MTDRPWRAVAAATAIACAAYWLAALVPGSATFSLLVIAVGSAAAILVLAAVSGGPESLQSGVRAATFGLGLGALLLFVYGLNGNDAVAAIVPVVVLGVGAVSALAPRGEPERLLPRTVAVAVACAIVIALAVVLPPLATLGAPLLPIPAVAGGDRVRELRRL